MDKSGRVHVSGRDVVSIIMGGGAGTRLFPLTKDRAKPAVPLAAKYRLVDIPISNCINSGLKRIFVLTQYNSTSLNRHIQQSYRFDEFSQGFVAIMAAQQTAGNKEGWYQGTADAVRQNLVHLHSHPHDYVLILSGDQLYRMDFHKLIEQHVASYADVTVATIPVRRESAKSFGIMDVDDEKRITRFVEKPKEDDLLESLKLEDPLLSTLNVHTSDDLYLASMGIYVFNRKVLAASLDNDLTDFGKHIIPSLIKTHRVFSYIYQGYWEDIGTIKAFYEANLDLCKPVPQFNFYDVNAPIYSRPRFLPGSKIENSTIERAVVADGCIINAAKIENSLVGVRARVHEGTTIKDCILMGSDYYETDANLIAAESNGIPRIGIGKNCRIERCIIDKNARIGDNVTITPEGKPANMDGPNFYIRDGIVVIPKNTHILNDSVI
jgi:glucose-1-phosphate adenylyltransferase